ncbi:hypothetical protein GCM10027403_00530 [Arthrobacter tecti]
MRDEPGRLRRFTDYVGITESAEDRRQRPVGSGKWWIHMGGIALCVVTAVVVSSMLL